MLESRINLHNGDELSDTPATGATARSAGAAASGAEARRTTGVRSNEWFATPEAAQPRRSGRANGGVVPPLPRPVRQESADTTAKTIMAGTYAKITERGLCHRAALCYAFPLIA